MSQEEGHATLLEGWYGKFVGNVHQAFDIIPGNRAFGTAGFTVSRWAWDTVG